jgi:multimeric flavodoxin WrbA
MANSTPLTALIIVCSLKSSTKPSSSELLGTQVLKELENHGVQGKIIRAIDYDIKPGVEIDMGDGDEWPKIREQMLASDILVIATPIWVGHPSSITQRILERLDAELSETDESGKQYTYGKVGVVAVVGNEDGAHHVSADVFQALSDIGFTIPAGGVTYWTGEAMQGVDYKDLDETPEEVAKTTKTLASNAAHLANLLKSQNYPA